MPAGGVVGRPPADVEVIGRCGRWTHAGPIKELRQRADVSFLLFRVQTRIRFIFDLFGHNFYSTFVDSFCMWNRVQSFPVLVPMTGSRLGIF